MKLWRKVVTCLMAAALLVSLSAGAVMAAEPYSYTVTFYAGNQGTFNGAGGLTVNSESAVITRSEDKIVITGLQAGDEVGLNAQAAITLDATSKYYVQGFRLSGRDNDTVEASVFVVDGDADYVVAYGIKGNQVEYTVNYRDDEGNELAESEVFYGNVGDKPVVAYKYIDGYVPEALGLTKTLSANSAENVFTFEYDRAPVNTVVVPGEGTGDADDTEDDDTADENDQEQETTTPDEGNEGETTEPEDETVEPGTEEEGEGSTETEEESQPSDTEEEMEDESQIIVDLDEESVPLAPGAEDGAEEVTDGTLTTYITVGVISVIVLIAAVVVAVVINKRKKA